MSDIGLVIFDCDGVLRRQRTPCHARAARRFGGGRLRHRRGARRMSGFPAAAWPPCRRCCAINSGPNCRRIGLERMRLQLFEPIDGVGSDLGGIAATLDRLTIPRCVASSSQMERLRLSLTSRDCRPGSCPICSVQPWSRRGSRAARSIPPCRRADGGCTDACLVVEDSAAGVEAARRAGMSRSAFVVGGSHARSAAYRCEAGDAGARSYL